MSDKPIHYAETQYGFDYGAAEITRIFSDPKKGWITLGLKTPKQDLQIYVTRTGKVRIHNNDGEWTAPKKQTKKVTK